MNTMIAPLDWWIIWKNFSRNILFKKIIWGFMMGLGRFFYRLMDFCQKFNALQRQDTSRMNNMIAPIDWWIIWKVFSRNILFKKIIWGFMMGIGWFFYRSMAFCQKFNALMTFKYVQKGLYCHISQLLKERINTLGITLALGIFFKTYEHAHNF